MIFLQVFKSWSQITSDPCRKNKGQTVVQFMARELALHKCSLKNARGKVSGRVSDPQPAAYR